MFLFLTHTNEKLHCRLTNLSVQHNEKGGTFLCEEESVAITYLYIFLFNRKQILPELFI